MSDQPGLQAHPESVEGDVAQEGVEELPGEIRMKSAKRGRSRNPSATPVATARTTSNALLTAEARSRLDERLLAVLAEHEVDELLRRLLVLGRDDGRDRIFDDGLSLLRQLDRLDIVPGRVRRPSRRRSRRRPPPR